MAGLRKGKTHTYDVTVHTRVEIKLIDGMVADNPESVAAAVRHNMKLNLGTSWTKSGMRYEHAHTDVSATLVEAEAEEVA